MGSNMFVSVSDSPSAGIGIRGEKFVRPSKATSPCFRAKTLTFRNSSAMANGWGRQSKRKSIWRGVTNEKTCYRHTNSVYSVQTVADDQLRQQPLLYAAYLFGFRFCQCARPAARF